MRAFVTFSEPIRVILLDKRSILIRWQLLPGGQNIRVGHFYFCFVPDGLLLVAIVSLISAIFILLAESLFLHHCFLWPDYALQFWNLPGFAILRPSAMSDSEADDLFLGPRITTSEDDSDVMPSIPDPLPSDNSDSENLTIPTIHSGHSDTDSVENAPLQSSETCAPSGNPRNLSTLNSSPNIQTANVPDVSLPLPTVPILPLPFFSPGFSSTFETLSDTEIYRSAHLRDRPVIFSLNNVSLFPISSKTSIPNFLSIKISLA